MKGLDYLGMGSKYWPTKNTIKLTPAGMALGAFDTTFGDVIPAMTEHLKSCKFPAVRIHLWWDNAHEIVPMDVIRARAPKWEKVAKKFPEITFYLSHSCEHTETSLLEVRRRMRLIRELAPSCIPVNCVWTGAKVPGAINECHNISASIKSPYIMSNDGVDIEEFDVAAYQRRHKRALITFFWGRGCNLRVSDGPAAPPKERKDAPTAAYLKRLILLAKVA